MDNLDQNNNNVPEITGESVNKSFRRGKQGCSTFICGVIVLLVILFKIKGMSFQDATSKYIDWNSDETETSDLIPKIFPTDDSYTALVYTDTFLLVVNCADNYSDDKVQDIVGNYRSAVEVFLLSDVSKYSECIDSDSIHASSEFSGSYYCQGEYTEGNLNVGSGNLRYLMEDDSVNFHYVESGGDTFGLEFTANDEVRNADILINSTEKDLSKYANSTYLDNNGVEDKDLSDYSEITVDLITGKVSAKLNEEDETN